MQNLIGTTIDASESETNLDDHAIDCRDEVCCLFDDDIVELCSELSISNEELIELHRRLGHLSCRIILETLKAKLVSVPRDLWRKQKAIGESEPTFIPQALLGEFDNTASINKYYKITGDPSAARKCIVCGGAKQIRRHIGSTRRNRNEHVGNQWNTDLAGPFRVRTRTKHRYFQVIQENRSRKGYLRLLKRKHEAADSLIAVLEAAKTVWPDRRNALLRIRMDNG